jgi:hypothetical protein
MISRMTTGRPQKRYDHRLRELVQRLQRSPELTRVCSPKIDQADWLPLTRASADAQKAAVLYLPPLVCAGPLGRSSPAGLFGTGVSDRAAREDAGGLAAAQS